MDIRYIFRYLIVTIFLTHDFYAVSEQDTECHFTLDAIPPLYYCKSTEFPETNAAPIANLEGEPSAFVHNCVNVISGQLCITNVDLILHHATNPLTVERSFAGSKVKDAPLGAGWHLNHSSFIAFDRSPKKLKEKITATVVEDHGGYMTYVNDNIPKNATSLSILLKKDCLNEAVTNNAQGFLSGQTNLRNQRVDISPNGICVARTGSGKYKEYQHLHKLADNFYWLSSVVHPTGNKFACDYERHDHQTRLCSMRMVDSKGITRGKLTYGKMLSGKEKGTYKQVILTDDWRFASYTFVKRKNGVNSLRRFESSDGGSEEYYYKIISHPGLYMELIEYKIQPLDRKLKIEYYDPSHNIVHGHDFNLKDPQDPRINRVKRLYATAGTDATYVPIYEFVYDLSVDHTKPTNSVREFKHGTCTVYDGLNHSTQYIFDENHRLAGIDKYDDSGSIYSQERMSWGDNNGINNTCLMARTFTCQGRELFSRNYQYDGAGNVLVDTLTGNLGSDWSKTYTKRNTYSNDGLNLLLEENDGYTTTKYIYYSGTNRLQAKYQGCSSTIMRRWFYTYNDDAALTSEITDDGSEMDQNDLRNVSERYITKNLPIGVDPIGYPLEICRYYVDLKSGQEHLIQKVKNTYNNKAKITKQEHYDRNGQHRYTLLWEYDYMGNVTKEVDAIGRVITRKFDLHGNCTYQQGPRKDCHKEFVYDFMNRLIAEKEIHSDGVILTTSHRYNVMGHKLATVDPNGNETLFFNDAFGRVKSIHLPAIKTETGEIRQPKIYRTYDGMSKLTSETDALGNVTHYDYNIRGQLQKVSYPDGTTEQNIYCLNGTLSCSKAKNGTKTVYSHDALGRPVSVEIQDYPSVLSATSKKYSGFHILEETDPMGAVTTYSYYPDGKLKRKTKGNEQSDYFYDPLGRLIKTVECNGDSPNDVTVAAVEYDLLNRVVEERIEDYAGTVISKVNYGYDIGGNVETLIKYNEAGTNITKTTYDSHGVPTKVVDGAGNVTMTKCDYNFRNAQGQGVLRKQVTDPLGNQTITIFDVLGRAVSVERKNAFGKRTQLQTKDYDLAGNLCTITDTVLGPDSDTHEIVAVMKYDAMNRLITCYEAVGTPDQKQTSIAYNKAGQKEKVVKNDKTEILHTYDAMGRLATLKSSDGSVSYQYNYDLNGNPIEVIDTILKTTSRRSFDVSNRLISEELSNGLAVHYINDRSGKPIKVMLPDNTAIGYSYEASLLKRVVRYDASDNQVYTHEYESYDMSRNLIRASFAKNAGALENLCDIIGRPTEIRTDNWREFNMRYDGVSNLLCRSIDDSLGSDATGYEYDDLYQLVKEKGDNKHEYTFDSMYNRIRKDGWLHELNGLHQLLDDGKFTYQYDANGNVIEKRSDQETITLTYDALDRLVAVVKGLEKVVYHYDENNRRMAKTFFRMDDPSGWIATKNVRFLYQSQNEIGSVDDTGKIYELRLLGIGKGAEIGASVAIEVQGRLYIPVHDHNGNISCLLDGSDGQVAESYRYTAFGEPLFEEALSPWTYASKRFDRETGFIYFGRRYYEPSTGRWITPDPIGREGGPNLYAYVLNAPITHFDLYGLVGITSGSSGIAGFLESCFDTIGNVIGAIARFPGAAMNFVGMHLVPIPYVKDAVEFGGWCLQGRNPKDFVPSWQREHSKLMKHEGYGYGDPRVMHVEYCGIMTSPEEFRGRLADLSSAYGGITVWGVYNDSQGFLLDLFEVGCQKLGIPTRMQKVAEDATRAIVNQMGDYKDEGTLMAYAHSQGAETVYNLSHGLRQKMNVVGFGPARILQKENFKGAQNHVGAMDFVPWADPYGMIKGLMTGNVYYLPSTGCPIKDHYYDSQQFIKMRTIIGDQFKSKYGEVL